MDSSTLTYFGSLIHYCKFLLFQYFFQRTPTNYSGIRPSTINNCTISSTSLTSVVASPHFTFTQATKPKLDYVHIVRLTHSYSNSNSIKLVFRPYSWGQPLIYMPTSNPLSTNSPFNLASCHAAHYYPNSKPCRITVEVTFAIHSCTSCFVSYNDIDLRPHQHIVDPMHIMLLMAYLIQCPII